ncbi:GNAT family N-acetyltransferase [Duganella violaceipulchra]|uniref:GNAT family N-acetyltransferase n=1 Tax=Duganella violaceipulchra TaxID=2849652 RepID=A0AA41HDF3_9BURK|nr:GNAT family N-acetyltransferase [Duganella violaceicalia]MBV6325380.1 GNAT family N-acetyltransferase [Duganella violaceicalia]MCP2012580.1 hypothetical protein [Duganella violaceicalia]
MNFTIEEIRHWLDVASPSISEAGIISTGRLAGKAGEVDYTIHAGWDLVFANLCDRSWGTFNVTLMRHIQSLEAKGIDINPILESAQLEDFHWRWLNKSLHYKGNSYQWFFLVAENYPQAACLIYHPKSSVSGAGDIFYVEYIAAAPWNRENILADRIFKGVGPKLLKCVISYAQEDLKLRPGFSLHSLPKAEQFYERLGMKAFQAYDKEGMKFFEWIDPESMAKG